MKMKEDMANLNPRPWVPLCSFFLHILVIFTVACVEKVIYKQCCVCIAGNERTHAYTQSLCPHFPQVSQH